VPSFTAFAVVGLLERHFGDLVDYAFTARMEDDLDDIANGDQEAVPWLATFYFGNGQVGLHGVVNDGLDDIDAREVNSIPIGTDDGGREIVVRVGRFGPYLQRGDDRVSIAEDLAPDELTVEKATELLDAPSGDRVLGRDPASDAPVVARAGRFGPYVQLGDLDDGEKPRTASLLKSMSLETVTLDDALRLLSLPRTLGTDPAGGEEVTAQNGRYGPYVKMGKETRSLDDEEQLFTVTLDDALRLLAEPKRRRGQRAVAPPLRELDADPVSGATIVVKAGRYGPYVTDGETNASLPKGETPEGVTFERAVDLLAERRARGPARKAAKKTASRSAKKPTKATKKAATKATKKAVKKTAAAD
jgi:DNA topoisomerase-1